MPKLMLALCFLLTLEYVSAATSLQNQSIANSRQWQRLLHYNDSSAFTFESEVDDPRFFASPTGKQSSLDELTATLDLFQSDPTARCRFPARYEWLAEQFDWSKENAFSQCTELNEWYQKINAHVVTLIFPASYMNSPSSMFGHLFLRVDSSEQKNDLLAYSINFGANVNNEDNSFLFTFNGLTGGYPGTVSILPYYEKVKEYNDIENRDIWEYSLNLSEAETRRLMLHIWELRNIEFDYYFIDENCAYRILSLVEVARPSIEALKHFSINAVPTDVVKYLSKSDTFSSARFRPSLATEFRQDLEQLSEIEKFWVLELYQKPELVDSTEFNQLNENTKAKVLEVVALWLRFQLVDSPDDESRRNQGYRYLLARSKLSVKSPLESSRPPQYRSDQGHDTILFSMGLLEQANNSYASLIFRPAYHNLTDPLAGYLEGAQISFLETELLIDEEFDSHLEALTLLELISISSRDEFFDPVSWSVEIGAERFYFSSDESELFSVFGGAAGVSYGSPLSQFYLMGALAFMNNDEVLASTAAQVGLRSGWVKYGDNTQSVFQLESLKDTSSAQLDVTKLQLSHSWNLSTHQAINFHFERIKLDSFYYSSAGIYYRLYM